MKIVRSHLPWSTPSFRADDWFNRAFEELGVIPRFGLPERLLDKGAGRHLAADVFENDHQYMVRVEMPGAKKEEIGVRFEEGVLHVSYNREGEEEGGSLSLTRSLRLPGPVEADKIGAKLEDGILSIILPRHESSKPRSIVIE